MNIKAKDKFRHFKGSIVEVTCLAKDSETLEDMVVYTHDNQIWVRPLLMFTEKIDPNRLDNITHQTYRFEKLKEEEK